MIYKLVNISSFSLPPVLISMLVNKD